MHDTERVLFNQTMDAAHDSWERKRELHKQILDLTQELAENVYQEYFAIRGCTAPASYEQAREELHRLRARIEDYGTLQVFKDHIQ